MKHDEINREVYDDANLHGKFTLSGSNTSHYMLQWQTSMYHLIKFANNLLITPIDMLS